MDVVSVSEMVELEKKANEEGLGYDQMMINAGTGLACIVHNKYGTLVPRKVLGLVGSGNNGGDTLIAIQKLLEKGWDATAYLVKKRSKNDPLITSLSEKNGQVITIEEDADFRKLQNEIGSAGIILDGILGTGFKLPLRKDISAPLKVINQIANLPPIIAVDCPSGIECDSSAAAEETLQADMTVCMAAVKEGMLKFPAFRYVGDLRTVDIGLPKNTSGNCKIQRFAADSTSVRSVLPKRPLNAHKGTFGTCMIVGGSTNYCGAVLLAAKSAYKVGAGLVRTAIPGSIYDAIAGQLPESTWIIIPESMGVISSAASTIIQQNLGRTKVMLVGPGMGHEKETLDFLKILLAFNRKRYEKSAIGFSSDKNKVGKKEPLEQPFFIFDADALRLLAGIKNWETRILKTAVLTPHPGEMAALTGKTVEVIQQDRENISRKFAKKWGHVVVLKGAITIIAAPDGKCTYIPVATPALATAGTGDVLAGMIAGLLAQDASPYDAAVAGAWLHARAGLLAAERIGQTYSVTASSVVDQIPNALYKITGTI